MTLTKRTYKTTFILDTRNQAKPVAELVEDLKAVLATLEADVIKENDLGRREFVRVLERNFTAGHYYEFTVEAPGSYASDIQAKFRLDKVVHRIIVQS